MSDLQNSNKPEIITGIEQDAQSEATRLVEKARQYVQDRQAACETKLASIKKEAAEKLQQQTAEISKNMASTIAVEQRRITLRIRDKLIRSINSRVGEYLASLIQQPGYKDILLGWVIEAAIGLNTAQAAVNASMAERKLLDEDLLKQAAARVKSMTGQQVQLTLSTEAPLPGQGIVVSASDGRTAFNNQVSTRLLRYQSEIRKLIYDTLFKDEL